MVNTDQHPEDLKALLRKQFGTLRAFERQHGLPVQAANAALKRPHDLAEAAIAAALGKHPADLWPSRYDAAGNRLSPQPPANYAHARGRKRA